MFFIRIQDNWSDAQLHSILAEVCFAQDKLENYIKNSQNKVVTNPKLEPTETTIEGKFSYKRGNHKYAIIKMNNCKKYWPYGVYTGLGRIVVI